MGAQNCGALIYGLLELIGALVKLQGFCGELQTLLNDLAFPLGGRKGELVVQLLDLLLKVIQVGT